jgi:hypothetical protein
MAASALYSCSKKTKKMRKKGGDAENSIRPSCVEFHQHTLSKNSPLALLSRFYRVLVRSKSDGSSLFRV